MTHFVVWLVHVSPYSQDIFYLCYRFTVYYLVRCTHRFKRPMLHCDMASHFIRHGPFVFLIILLSNNVFLYNLFCAWLV